MEHDTTIEGAVGDSCAETGRYLILSEYAPGLAALLSDDPTENAYQAFCRYVYWTVKHDYILSSPYLTLIRHPLANISWGFGPDQWVPRFISSKKLSMRSEELDYSYKNKPFSLMTLACDYPKVIGPLFCFLQEIVLTLKPSGDCLNWFMVAIYTKYRPKFLSKDNFLNQVRSYYKPETDIGAWTFIDAYERAAEKVWK